MDAVDVTAERGSPRRARRRMGVAALAAVAFLIAAASVTFLALRAARVREAVRAIEAAGGVVAWNPELAILMDDSLPHEERQRVWDSVLGRHHGKDGDRAGSAWLPALLGPEWLQDVGGVYFFPRSDPGLGTEDSASLSAMFAAHLSALPRLRVLLILERQVTDRTLEIIGGLGELERLTVHGHGMTDEGLRHLGRLSRLQHLEVTGSRFTAAGIRHLKALKSLESCVVPATRIPERSGESLRAKMRRLRAGQ